MDSLPLVSVICLCYNQKPYVAEAIQSVLLQTYPNVELIVVDDGSTDGSREEIEKILPGKEAQFIPLEKNQGNCRAFNLGFSKSRGDFIIDLAADDLLLPGRIEAGISDFANSGSNAGVHFSDAFITDTGGQILKTHFSRNANGHLTERVPSGHIYRELITRYFISAPTMMIRRKVLESLGGYDETLHYEDFDFWVRSAREFEYLFHPAPLVKKRQVKGSHSARQFTFRSRHFHSTYQVCEKIYDLNRTPEEDRALIQRCNYEMRQCLKTLNLSLIPKYQRLKTRVKQRNF